MEVLVVASGVAVAVGGWIVNGVLARRSARRQLRLEFLLGAYRRLDDVAQRTMTDDRGRAMESALSDVLLLGTKSQISLADALCRGFASDRAADVGPLLEDLRHGLRAELQLERVPPRKVWLRIDREDPWVVGLALVRARVAASTSAAPLPPDDGAVASEEGRLRQTLIEAHEEVMSDIAAGLTSRGVGIPGSPDAAVASAVAEGLILRATADAVDGLTVLRGLVEQGEPITPERLADYRALCAATRFAIRVNVSRRSR
ncbi:MAG TPA: hypothetical protein VNA20_05795 [Frankiaceae bacterium]|nr:hypothetical protein [Frankiaceae bacterium]